MPFSRRDFLRLSAAAPAWMAAPAFGQNDRPNIVMIYADDLGYGDVSCYGARRVRTPNIDRLARRGIRFTNAYSPAATCTPSRYSLLTGEYSFRQQRARVLPGDAPLLIDPGRPTLASMLRERGYRTGVSGKWHLGLGRGDVDWNGEVRPGPLEIGFDYSFLIPATGDRVPCVYVENHRVVGLDPADPIRVSFQQKVGSEPTGRENPELLKMHPSHGHDMTIVNGVSRIGYMTGGKAARWVDEDMADVITQKAVQFISNHARDPFFLYFSTHDIHVPRVPHPRFRNKTGMGPRGDAIVQLDWCVGEVMRALDRHKLTDNTLVVFSSDNGPVVDDGYHDEAVAKLGDHRPAGPWRGGKYSNFEAGTRVPFVVHWPRRVKPGVSGALVSQMDLYASLAQLTGASLPSGAAPDSAQVLPALLGQTRDGREHLVLHARALNLREGRWKYIEPNPGAAVNKNVNIELGADSGPQLYDVEKDPGETRNLARDYPAKVQEFQQKLDKIRKGAIPYAGEGTGN
jgi:arylsulfatase A-like enzyme